MTRWPSELRTSNSLADFAQKSIYHAVDQVLTPVGRLTGIVGQSASAAFPPSAAIFGAVGALVAAAHNVSDSLDAVQDLFTLLKDFSARLEVYSQQPVSYNLQVLLTEILVVLLEILGHATKIVKDKHRYRMKIFSRSIVLGDDKKIQDLVANLKRLTSSEQQLIGAETLSGTMRVENIASKNTAQLDRLNTSYDQMGVQIDRLADFYEGLKTHSDNRYDTTQLEVLKNVLNPSVAAADKFDAIFRAKQQESVPGFGDWIRSEKHFVDWKRSKSSLLFVSGVPGSGKSFLAHNITSYLHETAKDSGSSLPGHNVACFFFQETVQKTRSVHQALRDISFQLLQVDTAYAKHVTAKRFTSEDVSSIRSVWNNLFRDPFITTTASGRRTYIILDALDEALPEERLVLFQLFRDLQQNTRASNLHVALLGRPHIADEFSQPLGVLQTIRVDSLAHSNDIRRYIAFSIETSSLKQRPKALRDDITEILTSNAGGVFFYAKVMIGELAHKSRESSVRKVLKELPHGLTDTISHVLETHSATLSDEDIEDLNEVLCWVSQSHMPLSLGELDAVLRLRTDEGDPVDDLEHKLRITYGNLFEVIREDNLTTVDLQNPQNSIRTSSKKQSRLETTFASDQDEVGNAILSNSNPEATTVVFIHVTIADYFRDPKHHKVSSSVRPGVGIVLADAKVHLARVCTELVVKPGRLTLCSGRTQLLDYAKREWRSHVADLQHEMVAGEQAVALGHAVINTLTNQETLGAPDSWVGWGSHALWTAETAAPILSLLCREEVLAALPESERGWIKERIKTPVTVFEPALQLAAQRWLTPCSGMTIYGVRKVPQLINAYIDEAGDRKIESLDMELDTTQIERAAEWAELDRTAQWHYRLARTLLAFERYDDAVAQLEEASKLGGRIPQISYVLGEVHQSKNEYGKAVLSFSESLSRVDSGLSQTEHQASQIRRSSYFSLGECYGGLQRRRRCWQAGSVQVHSSLLLLLGFQSPISQPKGIHRQLRPEGSFSINRASLRSRLGYEGGLGDGGQCKYFKFSCA